MRDIIITAAGRRAKYLVLEIVLTLIFFYNQPNLLP